MNNKKNKKTFAQRAKHLIEVKYKNAKNDKLEAESLERELQHLMQEQEAYKKANGLGTEKTQNYNQDIQEFKWGGEDDNVVPNSETYTMFPENDMSFRDMNWMQKLPYLDILGMPKYKLILSNLANVDQVTAKTSTTTPYKQYNTKQKLPEAATNTEQAVVNGSTTTGTSETQQKRVGMQPLTPRPGTIKSSLNTNLVMDKTMKDRIALSELHKQLYNNQISELDKSSLVPSYISAGAGILSNLAQMAMDKRPNQVISPTYQPNRLDLTDERLAAEKQAIEAGNIARRNLRSGALSTGQMLSNLAGIEAAIQGQRGKTLTELGTAEKQYNIGALNQAAQYNATQKAQDLRVNQELQNAWRQRQRDYLSGAIGIVPQTIQDINRIKYQDKYLQQQRDLENKRLKATSDWMKNYYIAPDGTVKYRDGK